eukprot:m.915789 g.915789  ORF g.915789 m.915789 type:complete len:643 (+) comp23733_c0_seq4:110-2038(+)
MHCCDSRSRESSNTGDCSGSITSMSAETILDSGVLVTVKHASSPMEHKSIPSEQRNLQFHIALMRQARGGSTDMIVRITDEADAFFLYTLQLTEDDFAGLRRSQDIKVDFASFPRNFIQLLERCGNSADTRYLIELELPPAANASTALATLGVIETNDFKNLTHLCLKFVPGNDATVKKHLASCLAMEKESCASLRTQLAAMSREFSEKLEQAEHKVRTTSEELMAVKTELATATSRLEAEHAATMTHMKENALQSQTALQTRAAQTQRDLEARAQMQLDNLHAKLSDVEATKNTLAERLHDTEARLERVSAELSAAQAQTEASAATEKALRGENGALRKDCQQHEATLHDNRVTIAQLTQELKGKLEVEKQRDRLADSTQLRVDELQSALKEESNKFKDLEGRYTAAAAEISKGNNIIAKLQGDLSALHAKLDSRSAVVVRQEQAISAKEHDNQRLQRAVEDARTQRSSDREQIATLSAQVATLQADVDERDRTLKNNEGIITWLNKQLTDVKRGSVDHALHPLYHNPTATKGPRGSADTAAPGARPLRIPLAPKAGSMLLDPNRPHVVYSRGDPGITRLDKDTTLMDKYLPLTGKGKTVSPPPVKFPGEENLSQTRIPRAKQHTPPVLETPAATTAHIVT